MFIFPIQVYYEDTDAGGVVYHANYLKFLERARSEWLRHLGYEQVQIMQEHQCLFVVKSIQIDYLKPAYFNDVLQVRSKIAKASALRFDFEQDILRNQERLTTSMVTVVSVHAKSFKPSPAPQHLLSSLMEEQKSAK